MSQTRLWAMGWLFILNVAPLFGTLDVCAESAPFEQVVKLPGVEVLLCKDVCNVYVLRDGDPYRVKLTRGDSQEVTLHVRNFLVRPQSYRIAVHGPQWIAAEPAVLEGSTPAEATIRVPLRLKASPDAKPGVYMVALDATMDGKRYGQWFDLIAGVQE